MSNCGWKTAWRWWYASRLRVQGTVETRRYFAARPDLRVKYFKKEAHRVEARGGKLTGYRALPTRTAVRKKI